MTTPDLSASFSLDFSQYLQPTKPNATRGIIVRTVVCGLRTIRFTAWSRPSRRLRRVK